MTSKRPKVLMAMSGGVDSSVAAALLVREGYDVVGCFMRLGSPGETLDELEPVDCGTAALRSGRDHSNGVPDRSESGGTVSLKIGHQGCCSINDAQDARLVAAKLGIPFYVCNFKKDFGRIIDYFVSEYNAGRTPNPCVRCNDWLKFGKLHEYAKQIDAEFVASGHYARIHPSPSGRDPRLAGVALNATLEVQRAPTSPYGAGVALGATLVKRVIGRGGHRLLRGIDHDKDQSYVLFGAPRERLGEMLLPIGGYRKSEVRRMAKEFDLPVFNKPDSQEICFVPDNDYAGLVRRRTPEAFEPGRIVDSSGATVGEHAGHQHYTIGQRRGLGIAAGHALYVIEKDAATNTIVVGEKDDLRSSGCIAAEANWLVEKRQRDIEESRHPGNGWLACSAKIRYNAEPVPAQVRALDDDRIEVRFDHPQHAVAPGQAVVCYDGDVVMCGGWIRDAFDA